MRHALFALVALVLSSPANADIEKIAVPSEKGISFYWWPKLLPAGDWHHDREHSLHYGANAFAPDGFTFKDADSVMYASAIFKPRVPEAKSVDMLIANDKADFEANVPGVVIREASTISTADGQKLRSFTFLPQGKGNWERVTYGEEGEFYLIFTLNSRTQSAFDVAMHAYEEFVSRYRPQGGVP